MFTVSQIGEQVGFDAAAEIADANNYPSIRTMTVGQTSTSYQPLQELAMEPTLPWSVANSASIGVGNWTATSAVCWFYAKDLYNALGVPVGIISSNWGGTIIESWSDNATNAKCSEQRRKEAGAARPEGVEGPEAFGVEGVDLLGTLCTLHPTPYTQLPTPYTLHPTPYTHTHIPDAKHT